jgi:hypothetical protein
MGPVCSCCSCEVGTGLLLSPVVHTLLAGCGTRSDVGAPFSVFSTGCLDFCEGAICGTRSASRRRWMKKMLVEYLLFCAA